MHDVTDVDMEALMGTAEGRRELSKVSPAFFDWYYCGMTNAPHRTFWFNVFEKSRAKASRAGTKERVLLLAPRKHGKTEAVTSYILRAICLNRDIKILWICDTSATAKKRFNKVKQLLNSPKVLEDWTTAPELGYGPFADPEPKNKRDKWAADELIVMRSTISVHSTIYAIGSGTAPTGGHYDLIVADDLENQDSTNTASLRSKTRAWFFSELWPTLNPGGTMVVIGTKKHADDLYTHLENNRLWVTVKQKAIIQWPESYSVQEEFDEFTNTRQITGIQVKGESRVLWPNIAKVLSGGSKTGQSGIEYLLMELESMGRLLFAREMQHEVQDDEASPFKMHFLELAKSKGEHLRLGDIPPEVRHIVQGWDISLVDDAEKAREKDRDFTVGMTWGLDKDGNRYLLGMQRHRGMNIEKFKALVETEFQRFGGIKRVSKIAVEKNNFGELHYAGLSRTTDLPVVPHQTGKNKADPWEGVPSLSHLFESGKVVLPYNVECPLTKENIDVLVGELWGLGVEKHDDTVMALWISETVLRNTRFVYQYGTGELTKDEELELAEAQPHEDDFWKERYLEETEQAKSPAQAFWEEMSEWIDFGDD